MQFVRHILAHGDVAMLHRVPCINLHKIVWVVSLQNGLSIRQGFFLLRNFFLLCLIFIVYMSTSILQ